MGGRWHLVGSGLFAFVLLGLAQAIFGPALPVYARTFGLTTAGAGWLISAFWVGCFAGVVGMFLAAGRVGPRPGLAAVGVGALILALSPAWAGVLAGGAVFGAGYGALAAVYNPRVLAAFGARGGAMMSLLNAIFSLGAIAAPLVFLALGADPRATFLLFAGFATLVWLGSTGLGAMEGAGAAGARAPLRPRWTILALGAAAIGMEAALVSLGPSALVRAGLAEAGAAQLLSLFYVAYLVARTTLIFVADRVPPMALYSGAMAGMAACAGLAVAGWPGVAFVPMGAAASLFFHAFFVAGTRAMGNDPRVAPVVIGAGLTGAIALPLAVAQAMEGLGPLGFFQIVLVWAGVLMLAGLALRRRLGG